MRPTKVVRATSEQEITLGEQMMFLRNMGKTLEKNIGLFDRAVEDLAAVEQRLQRLEAGD